MSGTYEMHADQSVHPPDVVTLKSQCLYNSFGCADLIKRIQNNILGLPLPRTAPERTDMLSLILGLSLIYLVKEHLVVKTRYKRSFLQKALISDLDANVATDVACYLRLTILQKKWWSYAGSNRRPPECKSGALPAEL
jgi:hypothetical protein